MTSPERHWAHSALQSAELELALAQDEYELLGVRVQSLQQAVDGLRGIVGKPLDGDARTNRARRDAMMRSLNSRNEAVPEIKTPTRRQPVDSSTMRLVHVLIDSGTPLSEADIIVRFESHEWEQSPAAVQQALRRSQHYGFIDRLPDGTYQNTDAGRTALEKAAIEEDAQDVLRLLRHSKS
jgi:hypothetical protein